MAANRRHKVSYATQCMRSELKQMFLWVFIMANLVGQAVWHYGRWGQNLSNMVVGGGLSSIGVVGTAVMILVVWHDQRRDKRLDQLAEEEARQTMLLNERRDRRQI